MSDDTDGPASIDTTCPSCGERMRPKQLRSGALVLRCAGCGQVTIT